MRTPPRADTTSFAGITWDLVWFRHRRPVFLHLSLPVALYRGEERNRVGEGSGSGKVREGNGTA